MRSAILALAMLSTLILAGCSGPSSRDTDEDGLYDSEEKAGWRVEVYLLDVTNKVYERREYTATSDPKAYDSDGDGLSDSEEFFLVPPTDPMKADTDEDGLTDCQETIHTVLAQCTADFEGPFDGGTGTSPVHADSDPGPGRYLTENFQLVGNLPEGFTVQRGDGIPDGQELAGYRITLPSGSSRTIRSDPMDKDSDGDGLEDGEELHLFSSDPTVVDTDGDGCPDGFDLFPGRSERYRPGLDRFLLKEDMDAVGGAQLRFRINIVNQFINAPQTGQRSVETGQATSIRDMEPPAVRLGACQDEGSARYSPHAPWTLLEITAFDVDGNTLDGIDIFSTTSGPTDPSFVASMWWNPRTGEFAWEAGDWNRAGGTFKPAGGLLHVRGVEGELWLRPTVV